jgi:hypothetical protein
MSTERHAGAVNDLSPLLAEARRIAEEVCDAERECSYAIQAGANVHGAISRYTGLADDIAPRLAAALLALIPVVEAAQRCVSDVCEDDDLIHLERLYEALATTLSKALKP